jgi:hypothetical protein
MKHGIGIGVIGLFLTTTLAGEEPCATGSISRIDGKWYQSIIYPTQLERAPLWHPELEPQPPLSPGRALALASNKLGVLFPKIRDWHAMRVGLEWSLKPDHWYYEVYFVRSPDPRGQGGEAQSFTVNVLMNGDVIQPSVRKGQGKAGDHGTAP